MRQPEAQRVECRDSLLRSALDAASVAGRDLAPTGHLHIYQVKHLTFHGRKPGVESSVKGRRETSPEKGIEMQDVAELMKQLASSLNQSPKYRSLVRETLDLARQLEDPAYAAECDAREEAAIQQRNATRAANDRARAAAEVAATRAAACPRCFSTHAGEC